jgi:hypothetical protein
MDTLGPPRWIAGTRRGQGIFQRAHRLAQLRTMPPQFLQKGLI